MTRRAEPSRRVDEPVPGYYRMRLVRMGPWVPALIEHGPHGWRCSISGVSTGFPSQDPTQVTDLFKIALYGVVIKKDEYDKMMKNLHPSPRKSIKMSSEPPIF
jgi:hypothetical protein